MIGVDEQTTENFVPIFSGGDPMFWMTFMELRFLRDYCLESKKLKFAEDFMEGEARDWFQWRQSLWPFSSWEDLKKNLLLRFGNNNDRELMKIVVENQRILDEMINKQIEEQDVKAIVARNLIQVQIPVLEPCHRDRLNENGGLSLRMMHPESLLQNIDLPLFKGVNPYGWIAQAERSFRLSQCPEDKKLYFVSLSLEGESLKWYNEELRREAFTDWREFKTRLLTRFGVIKKQSPPEVLTESNAFFETKVIDNSEWVKEKEISEDKESLPLFQCQKTIPRSGSTKEEVHDEIQEMNTIQQKELTIPKAVAKTFVGNTWSFKDVIKVCCDRLQVAGGREPFIFRNLLRPQLSILKFKLIDVGSNAYMFQDIPGFQNSRVHQLFDRMFNTRQGLPTLLQKQKSPKSWSFKFKNRSQTRNWAQEQLWFMVKESLMKKRTQFQIWKLLKHHNMFQIVRETRLCKNRKGEAMAERENDTQLQKMKETQLIGEYERCDYTNETISLQFGEMLLSLRCALVIFEFLINLQDETSNAATKSEDKIQQLIISVQHVFIHREMDILKYEEGLPNDVEWEIAWTAVFEHSIQGTNRWLTVLTRDDSMLTKLNNNIIQVQVQRKQKNLKFYKSRLFKYEVARRRALLLNFLTCGQAYVMLVSWCFLVAHRDKRKLQGLLRILASREEVKTEHRVVNSAVFIDGFHSEHRTATIFAAVCVTLKAVALQDMEWFTQLWSEIFQELSNEMRIHEIDNRGYYCGTWILLEKLKQQFSHLQPAQIRESRNLIAGNKEQCQHHGTRIETARMTRSFLYEYADVDTATIVLDVVFKGGDLLQLHVHDSVTKAPNIGLKTANVISGINDSKYFLHILNFATCCGFENDSFIWHRWKSKPVTIVTFEGWNSGAVVAEVTSLYTQDQASTALAEFATWEKQKPSFEDLPAWGQAEFCSGGY